MSPPVLRMNRARAEKAINPSAIFHMGSLQKKAPDDAGA
jgi:hypothetical protein